jgi:predicted DNA binding protein
VLLEEEEEAEEEGRRRRRSSVAASDAVSEGRRLLTPRELNVVAQASPT